MGRLVKPIFRWFPVTTERREFVNPIILNWRRVYPYYFLPFGTPHPEAANSSPFVLALEYDVLGYRANSKASFFEPSRDFLFRVVLETPEHRVFEPLVALLACVV